MFSVTELSAALFDAGTFSAELAQIVQLGAADAAEAFDFDFGDGGAVKRENSLDADAVADLADGEAFADSAVFAGDDDAFEGLKTLVSTFGDLDGDADGVAGAELRNVIFQVFLLLVLSLRPLKMSKSSCAMENMILLLIVYTLHFMDISKRSLTI